MNKPHGDRARTVVRKPRRTATANAVRVLLVVSLIASVVGSLLWTPTPLLLWNSTPSSPVGLYAIIDRPNPRAGDMVVAWAPTAARQMAAARNYLPFTVPLVKRIAAAEGDRICAAGDRVLVNNRIAALRRSRDPSGRPMPSWSGCAELKRGELFLLSSGEPYAFDGRYFGVTRASQVVGGAWLLWPH